MKKLLIYGDHYKNNSAYARNIRDLLPFLTKEYEVRQVSLGWNGLPPSKDIVCYPTELPDVKDYWAPSILHYALEDFKPDIVLTIQDFYITKNIGFTLSQPSNFKWVHWGTLDGEPLDYTAREPVRWMDYIFYYSNFAKTEVEKIHPNTQGEVLYPPVNPKIFHAENQTALRKQYKLENMKVMINCSRNQNRKNLPILLDALNILKDEIPELVLILSSTIQTSFGDSKDGYELDYFIRDRGLETRIIAPSRKDEGVIDDEMLNMQYNLADVMVHPSIGEGFGMPIAEAGASLVPAIGVKHSAITEVIGEGGLLVKPKAFTYTQSGTKYYFCTPKDLAKAIRKFFNLSEQKKSEMRKKARDFALTLKPELVAKQMISAFDRIIKNDITSIAKG